MRRINGFTLIEMLTVIVIILLLLGLGVAIGPGLLGLGEELETKATLKTLEMINAEYESLTGQPVQLDPIYWDSMAAPAGDMWYGRFSNKWEYASRSIQYFAYQTAGISSIEPLWNKLPKFEARRYVIYNPFDNGQNNRETFDMKVQAGGAQLNHGGFEEGGGYVYKIDVADAWGQPIVYKSHHINSAAATSAGVNTDIRTSWLPNKGTFFMSSGPDLKLGDVNVSDKTTNRWKASLDNLYSYDVGDIGE